MIDIRWEHNCQHDIMIDYENGTEVWVKCGLVTSDQIFCSYNFYTRSFNLLPTTFKEAVKNKHWKGLCNTLFVDASNYMYNVCDQFQIIDAVAKYATYLLAESEIDMTKLNIMHLCASFFFKSMKHYGVHRSLEEVCYMFNIKTKHFLSKAAQITETQVQIDDSLPSQILPRISFEPALSYAQQNEIGHKANKIYEKVNAQPKVVLAYVLYMYFLNNPNCKKMSMTFVSKLIGVSATSIKRLKMVFKNK